MNKGDSIQLTSSQDTQNPTTYLATSDDSPISGAEDPKVVIYFFGDFGNTTSNTLSSHLKTMLEKYPNDLAVVWKDYPNVTLNDQSLNAAIAARCAQKQDKFWEFHDILIDNTDLLSDDLYGQLASQLDLWEWSFNRCVEKQKTLSLVQYDILIAHELSVIASPTLFINNKPISGYVSKQELEQLILTAQE
jgi:protein-disulfide isomerase